MLNDDEKYSFFFIYKWNKNLIFSLFFLIFKVDYFIFAKVEKVKSLEK